MTRRLRVVGTTLAIGAAMICLSVFQAYGPIAGVATTGFAMIFFAFFIGVAWDA